MNRPSREAIMDLLEGQVDYMKTTLYEYQRRSAAYMVQKESQETYFLDPRLEEIQGPEGAYYYDRVAGTVLSDKRLYPDVKGGILAETMGYGKTLICISVIVATRGHLPRMMDDPHIELIPDSNSTGARTLIEMAAAANARYCLPWTSILHLAAGRRLFQKYRNAYVSHRDVVSSASKYSRRREQKACRLFVSSATLIIVPPNLVTHWLHEIEKHVDTTEAGLKTLVINDVKTKLPPAEELSEYDIVLFSKSRFGKEVGALNTYSLARRKNSALDPEEYSPLRQVYWLRVIVDEGHDFARAAAQTQSLQIFRLLHVERRWVVSGTPSKGLYGIEVPLGTSDETDISILESRKVGALDQEKANLGQLKAMMVEFLGVKPWSNPSGQDSAKWSTYIQPTGSGPTLRRTLQSLVVRHQPQEHYFHKY
ncbi:hypothetical protein KEM56_004551 [Ascosphaera pollenicola]|nr:hypothetical protein KEM56_004551 [Ascosphaera pollenicola]